MINYLKEKFRKQPKTWFSSDLHFSHKNVITYCNRPFKDIEEMNEALIKLWNETVKKQDIIYVLGDFSLNPKWSRLLIPKLNGKKILVAGNHDACHISHKKCGKMVSRYLEDGWAEVHPHYKHLQLKNGQNVVLSHLPYDNEYDDRYKQYKLPYQGNILLHGHLHGKYKKKGNQIDVGYDAHQKILSEEEVIQLIEDKRDFIPSHLTKYFQEKAKVSGNNDDENV